MKNSILKYGIIGGGLLSLAFLAFALISGGEVDAGSYRLGEVIGYSTMVIVLTLVFFGIKNYRDRRPGGRLGFGEGLKVGLGISFVAAVIFGLYTWIFYGLFAPDHLEKTYLAYKDMVMAEGLEPEALRAALKELEGSRDMFINPGFMALLMSGTVFPIGCVIALVSILILKNKNGTDRPSGRSKTANE